MLVIRRVIYFSTNISLAILALLIIEGFVAYVKQLLWIYSPPFEVESNTASRAYMIVIPLIMALFDSRLMKRGFIAGWLTNCETISPMNYNLSFLGCYLRTCFFFLPVLAYSSIFFDLYSNKLNIIALLHLSAPTIDITFFLSFLFVILFIPLSIMINRGHQGIHDYILHILFQRRNSNVSFRMNILKTLILTTITTILASTLLYIVIINSSYYKIYIYYMNVAAETISERSPDLSSWLHINDKKMDNAKNLIDSLKISLKQSSIVKNVMLDIDGSIEEDNGEQYTVIDIATHINLEDKSAIYMIANAVALELNLHEQDIEKFRIKLSKRFVFDLIAYERAVTFNLQKVGGVVQLASGYDSFRFGRRIPIGL